MKAAARRCFDGRQMVSASWEVWWHGWQVGLRTHVDNQVHSYGDVEQEVTMEQPGTGNGTFW